MGSTTVHRSLAAAPMLDALRRNVILFAGIIANALISGLAVPGMMSPRGALGPSGLLAESPVKAILGILLVMAIMTAVSGVVGRVCNAAVGMFVLGTGVFALTWRLATATELIWAGSMDLLWLESLLWGGLVLACAIGVFRIAGPLEDIVPAESNRPPAWILSRDALGSAACAAAVIPAVWLIAQAPDKGQVVGAAFVGSVIAGMLGRLLSPHVQPVLLFAAPCVAGAVALMVSGMMMSGPLDEAFIDGSLSPLRLVMPIDYAAGGIAGVAIGLGWAKSFLHHEE